jgi:zona occludens toxin (predicted ATPase)
MGKRRKQKESIEITQRYSWKTKDKYNTYEKAAGALNKYQEKKGVFKIRRRTKNGKTIRFDVMSGTPIPRKE